MQSMNERYMQGNFLTIYLSLSLSLSLSSQWLRNVWCEVLLERGPASCVCVCVCCVCVCVTTLSVCVCVCV